MSIKVHGYDLKEIYQGLGAPCRVEALKDKVYEGHLHAIDPQTHTVLLIQLLSLEEMDKFMDAPPQLETICRPELVKERREKLVKLFANHRIPVESDEGSTIRIMDVVTIRPPYDVASTDGPSTVVRDRVRDMVHGWIQQGLL
ncbi:Gem (Nuclear organelle) associated protein 6 [Actinomortierella wolfii]|nr:Gem (Nuclear organelle) associated protein 6 [Actinomortierella wolfii]